MNMGRFGDQIRVKAVVVSFIAYVVVSVVASIVLVQAWLPAGISAEEAARLAESAPLLVNGQLVIGTVLGLAAGFLACHLGGAGGLRNSLAVGVVLIGYAALATVLHPTAPLWQHIVHFIAPVPLTLLGGLLRLKAQS